MVWFAVGRKAPHLEPSFHEPLWRLLSCGFQQRVTINIMSG
ncbi:hypothetical protein [Dulcicalothrix desertica]|nr:hypothetical protein [Dulcicalothrix desertica]